MNNEIIQKRLSLYQTKTIDDEQDALKEILQEIILYVLSKTDFFKHASFHGGTSLRILHNLPRFSEDLDFALHTPDLKFGWRAYFDEIICACKEFGIEPEVVDKGNVGKTVQKMFLKDNSIGKLLDLQFHHHPGQKFRIKLEIDINPPLGAASEIKFLNFPNDCSITIHELPSNFSGKLHALLCRTYTKGRDWFDLTWYIKNFCKPNYELLTTAFNQTGPWQDQNIQINPSWLVAELRHKITSIDWETAVTDVGKFLQESEKISLRIMGAGIFCCTN